MAPSPGTAPAGRAFRGPARAVLLPPSAAFAVALLLFAAVVPPAGSAQVFQRPAAFLSTAFGGAPPPAREIRLTGAMQARIRRIMGHGVGSRVRYWKRGGRSVWILNRIGKYKPITTGWIVSSGRIERARVLIYRESHGYEVRYPRFTNQFRGATLRGSRLSRSIGNISGATLSVNSMKRMGALALYLHSLTE